MSPVLASAAAEERDELTADEAREYIAEQTQRHFGLTIDEFVQAAEAGELPEDDPAAIHLAILTGAKLHSC